MAILAHLFISTYYVKIGSGALIHSNVLKHNYAIVTAGLDNKRRRNDENIMTKKNTHKKKKKKKKKNTYETTDTRT